MISRGAIRAYLDRDLRDYSWLKQASRRQLESSVSELLPPPYFLTKPMKQQLACFLIGCSCDSFLFFLDMGTGKTKLILDLLYYRIMSGDFSRALVMVDGLVPIESWLAQAAEHTPKLRVVGLTGQPRRRWDVLRRKGADVYVTNWAGLLAMVSKLSDAPARSGGKKAKRQRLISTELLEEFRSLFGAMVIDESQVIKNHRSWSFHLAKAMSETIKVRYALTGTPINRDPADLWAQFRAIDRGETFGQTLSIYRAAFFDATVNYWGGYEYKFRKSMEPDLRRLMGNRSISYTTEECSELPPLRKIEVPIKMPAATKRYYKEIIERLVKVRGDYRKINNVFMSMRQLSSGFLKLRIEGEDGQFTTEVIEMDENPRLAAAQSLMGSFPEHCKMAVFYEFIRSGDQVEAVVRDLQLPYVRLVAGDPTNGQKLRKFQTDPRCRLILLNNKIGATTLNLQAANYHLFYESPVSAITRQQAERRCWRTGQKKTMFLYDLVMTPGPDRRILGFIREGRDLLKALTRGKIDLLAEFQEES